MYYREKESSIFDKEYFISKVDDNVVCELLKYRSGLEILRLTTFEKNRSSSGHREVYENRVKSKNFNNKWKSVSYAQFKRQLDIMNPDKTIKLKQ